MSNEAKEIFLTVITMLLGISILFNLIFSFVLADLSGEHRAYKQQICRLDKANWACVGR